MAKAYDVRASALVNIDPADPRAFSFDRAVWLWGSAVEEAMEAEEGKVKTQGKNAERMRRGARVRALNRMLAEDGSTVGQFRSPTHATFGRGARTGPAVGSERERPDRPGFFE